MLDRQSHRLVAALRFSQEVVEVRRAPPARDGGLGLDRGHALDVFHAQRPEDDEVTVQRRHVDRPGHSAQA